MIPHNIDLSPGVKEPLCGNGWLAQHLHDYDGWEPTIEMNLGNVHYCMTVKDASVLNKVIKANK